MSLLLVAKWGSWKRLGGHCYLAQEKLNEISTILHICSWYWHLVLCYIWSIVTSLLMSQMFPKEQDENILYFSLCELVSLWWWLTKIFWQENLKLSSQNKIIFNISVMRSVHRRAMLTSVAEPDCSREACWVRSLSSRVAKPCVTSRTRLTGPVCRKEEVFLWRPPGPTL